MKILIVIFFFGSAVHAEEVVKVLDQVSPTGGSPYSVSGKFVPNDQNKELGRAWIEVEIVGDYYDADLDREIYKISANVPGLAFNPSANTVTYQSKTAGKPRVICGKFDSGNFFIQSSVKPTGRCQFITKVEKRAVDDGHYIKDKAFVSVEMKIE